jgi:hypothetical protein
MEFLLLVDFLKSVADKKNQTVMSKHAMLNLFNDIHKEQSFISEVLKEIQIRQWENTDLWAYQTWDQIPSRSNHPLSTGHFRR